MMLSIEDLNGYGQGRMEDDFDRCDRRGKRAAKDDFAEGWMALAVRHKLWSHFTDRARARLQGDA